MSLPLAIRRPFAALLGAWVVGAALQAAWATPPASGERPRAASRAEEFPGRQQAFESSAEAPPRRSSRTAAVADADGRDEPTHALPRPGAAPDDRASQSGWGAFFSVAASLTIVIGLFGGVAWLLRQNLPGGARTLPREVFENLGRAALVGRQQVCLLRCGRQLLLAATSPSSVEPLLTIDQPEEVERLVALCKQKDPHSASGAFDRVLRQLTRETKTPELNAPRRAAPVPTLRRAASSEGPDA